MTKSVGFFELGITYAKSADFLSEACRSEALKINRTEPIDYLYAHAFELILKGSMLEHDPTRDVEEFKHDLLSAYDEVRQTQLLEDLIGSVEKAVRARWKWYLRNARDKYQSDLQLSHLSIEDCEGFGIVDNEAIGRELPELRKQVIWLSERHKAGGGSFRYLRCGWDQRDYVRAFGLADDVVWKSSQWACEEMYNHFRKHCSSN
ncbi:hypothetical protein JQX09_20805 [Sulfitobacter pseudonitzschiae]|uniref:Uncharacterized protein n=1 Tax=Pseudosulfitobacter pseudonitzschiae TaxID=1402135 RepID=A0A9Q2NLR4_9RHOB|nr:hypothetical protein [Pseudosulfitobacter pseudonitzschiae]MBM2294368.1 hypothetical protein [Pseudosulfitobacter pseudonitzschiae]MBM2299293.1 hypothetical protein [Pseudosulfitobacter pseudonitzschiae]MBM2304200.1 hypothetical protein [Pseudosulfitobacter pseudonitzschiae]MBM2313980.1 hypothetical protein [Pseudosulfitobacter pseudonitzschiae]MBM2318895.1 hypothetical protein [Pseudosulfitobacter pseudonitzschiae]